MARGVAAAGGKAAVQGGGADADADVGGRTIVPSGVGAAGGESGLATPPPAERSPGELQARSRGPRSPAMSPAYMSDAGVKEQARTLAPVANLMAQVQV